MPTAPVRTRNPAGRLPPRRHWRASRLSLKPVPTGVMRLALVLTAIIAADAAAQTSGQRRIPVRRHTPTRIAPMPLTPSPSPTIENIPAPIAEQPGEVTEVIIRNEAGEIVNGELDEGEFFIGPAPAPVVVGDPAGPSVVHPIGDPMTHGSMPGGDGFVSGDLSVLHGDHCDQCNSAGCDGQCAPTPLNASRLGYHQQARIEAIARVLANPFADFWVRAEYVHLFVDGQSVPALVSTGPVADIEDAGVLGEPGVSVLYGNDRLNEDDRSAGRIEIGRYLGDSGLGVSASYLFADDASSSFMADGSTASVLARPFIDLQPGSVGNNAELVQFPGTFTGDIDVTSSTEFAAADALVHAIFVSTPGRRIDGFVGYQFLKLDDDLQISDSKRVIGGTTGLTLGTTFSESDRFRTRNDFHGVGFGVRTRHCVNGWALSSTLKLALGLTDATIHRDGTSTSVVPLVGGGSETQVRDSGLLVQDSNRGRRSIDQFAVAPELRFQLSRRLASGWDATFGYHFLYWSRVARAGDQIDPLVNLTQVGVGGLQGVGRPSDSILMDDSIVHGLTFGLSHEF